MDNHDPHPGSNAMLRAPDQVGRIAFAPTPQPAPFRALDFSKVNMDQLVGDGISASVDRDGKVHVRQVPVRDGMMRWADDPQVIGIPNAEEAARQAAEQRQAELQAEAAQQAEVAAHLDQLRDHFAGQAIGPSIDAARDIGGKMTGANFDLPYMVAKLAYDIADAMMAERARRQFSGGRESRIED